MRRTIARRLVIQGTNAVLGLLLALGAVLPGKAWAYDGITVGQVAFVEVGNDGSGFGFQLVGSPSLCSAQPTRGWGIVSITRTGATQEGVKSLLATLMAAKLSGSNVRVYAYNNGTDDCNVFVVDIL